MEKKFPAVGLVTRWEAELLVQSREIPIIVTDDLDADKRTHLLFDHALTTESYKDKSNGKVFMLAHQGDPKYFWNGQRFIDLQSSVFETFTWEEKYFLEHSLWMVDVHAQELDQRKLFRWDDVESFAPATGKACHRFRMRNGDDWVVDEILLGSDLRFWVQHMGMKATLAQKIRENQSATILEVQWSFETSLGEYESPTVIPNSQENIYPAQLLFFPMINGQKGTTIVSFSRISPEVWDDKNEFAKRLRQIRRQIQKIFSKDPMQERLIVHGEGLLCKPLNAKTRKELDQDLPKKMMLLNPFLSTNSIQSVCGTVFSSNQPGQTYEAKENFDGPSVGW